MKNTLTRSKRDTSQQKQERKSRHQLAERFEDFDWITNPTLVDKGEDFFVTIWDNGLSTGLTFLVQLKSTSNLQSLRHSAREIAYSFKVKDLEHWSISAVPVVIVVWDVQQKSGVWITINDAIAQLEQRVPNWRQRKKLEIRVPLRNTTNQEGLSELRRIIADLLLPVVSKGRDLHITSAFVFPPTPEGKDALAKFMRHIETGESVTITGNFIKNFELSEWWTRLYGEMEFTEEGELTLEPAPSMEIITATLEIKSRTGQGATIKYLELKVIRRGTIQISFSNALQAYPLQFTFTFGLKDRSLHLHMQFEPRKATIVAAHEVLEFLVALHIGGEGELTFLTTQESVRFNLPSRLMQEPEKQFLDAFRNLRKIEQIFGVRFALDEGWEIQDKEFAAINELTDVIATGRSAMTNGRVTLHSDNSALPSLLESARSHQQLHVRMESHESAMSLLGIEIALGPLKRYVKGKLENTIEELETLEKRQADEPIEIRLVGAEVVDEFANWIPQQSASSTNEEKSAV